MVDLVQSSASILFLPSSPLDMNFMLRIAIGCYSALMSYYQLAANNPGLGAAVGPIQPGPLRISQGSKLSWAGPLTGSTCFLTQVEPARPTELIFLNFAKRIFFLKKKEKGELG